MPIGNLPRWQQTVAGSCVDATKHGRSGLEQKKARRIGSTNLNERLLRAAFTHDDAGFQGKRRKLRV